MKSDESIINSVKNSLLVLLIFCFTPVQSNKTDIAKITESIEKIRNNHGVAAVTVLLVSKDEVLLDEYFGVRDWDTKQPFTNKDMFRIGSISKAFAGLLALRLQQKGLIDLNDGINDYGLKPYLKNTFPDQNITLAQLLEHTAGLADLAKAEWDYNDSKSISLKQAFDLKLGNHKTNWPPGMHRSYSNVGPGLFGLALELKLGESYESLMQKYVFDPLNMQNSNLFLTPEIKQRLITGYDRDGKKPIPYWHNIYRPFAAINTNNHDMIQWLQALLKQDQAFLSQADRQRLLQPQTTLAAKSDLKYGYGLGLYQWQTDGHSFYGHGGDADGYLTRFGFNPESGLAYFVMINAFNKQPLNQVVGLIEHQIIKDLPKPQYPLRLDLAPSEVESYVGEYRQVTKRFGSLKPALSNRLTISYDGRQLFYQLSNGRKVAIHGVRKNHFRTTNQSTATMSFVAHRDKQYFQGEVGNFVKINCQTCDIGK